MRKKATGTQWKLEKESEGMGQRGEGVDERREI